MSNSGNQCVTMHQPWASLLVHGIKRIEGRSWPCPIRGRLWIHAASKVPEADTILAMEEFYREIYKEDGISEIEFPKDYPTSALLGCVNVVGCVKKDQLLSCEQLPVGVRLEGQTDFCWLCEDPQKLVLPLSMGGRQRVYNLPRQVTLGTLRPCKGPNGPNPFRFPPLDKFVTFSPGPGSRQAATMLPRSAMNPSSVRLDSVIAGAKKASLQYDKKLAGVASSSGPSGWGNSYSSPNSHVKRRDTPKDPNEKRDRHNAPFWTTGTQ